VDLLVLRIFQREVSYQCKFALSAAKELDIALLMGSQVEVWKHLQTILIASASLSKMLWGSSGNKELERQSLRESLQVADDSPIRDVDLRNDFEHFDERLERWFETSENRGFIGRNIGSDTMILIGSQPPPDRFQHYDPERGLVTFWDHTIELREVLAEIVRILPLAEAESRKPHWESAPEHQAAPTDS
jgi:hypothetical protein